MRIIAVISSSLERRRHLIKFNKMGNNDTEETDQVLPYGIDSNPISDSRGLYTQTSVLGENFIVGYIGENQITEPGEIALFSTDDNGAVQIRFHLKKDGTAELGGNNDFLVRFNELEKGFNELRDDHNALIVKYNTHVHPYVGLVVGVPGATTPTASTDTPSTANISASKISELKVS